MKYIITPTNALFMDYLYENNINRNDKEIIKINSYVYLLGMRLKETDDIVFYAEHLFDPIDLNNIKLELYRRI